MTRGQIPERAPIGDSFIGVVLSYQQNTFLAPAPLPDALVVAEGTFVVRYGLRYLGKHHLSIVPGIVALDYGEMLTGETAWEFLLKKSNLYPRADVVGYRNDGADEMIVVKLLDIALAPQALVYADAHATRPIASPTAFIAVPDDPLSPRLRNSLPHYSSLADWQATTANKTD